MPRYFFDVRNDDACSFDDRGMILGGIEAARDEATRTLTECARRVSPGAVRRVIGIEVRDEAKQPLLEARLIFQPARLG
jgi:hypothetical protein